MAETAEHEYVAGLARTAVTALAPHELVFFDGFSDAYFRASRAARYSRASRASRASRDAARVLAAPRGRDEILGSGLDTLEALVTPVALAAATTVYQHLLDRAGDAAVRAGERRLSRLRRVFGARRAPSPGGAADPPPAASDTGGAPGAEAAPGAEGREGVSAAAGVPDAAVRRERARVAAVARARELGLTAEQAQALVDVILTTIESGR